MNKLGEMKQMYIYEMILDILEKKGPTSIPSICQEMNQLTWNDQDEDRLVQLSQIKTAIRRKKDLFKVEDNVVFIDPEKDIQLLTINIGGAFEPSITVKVDFIRNRFSFFVWHFDSKLSSKNSLQPVQPCGNLEDFKKELYRIKPWEWRADYQPEGMVLDGIFWSMKLVTKGKVYESEGIQCFPKEWTKLCKSLSKLTGFNFY